MRPHPVPSPADDESDLFRNHLDSLIDMRHEFVRLSGLIDWKRFDEAFGELLRGEGAARVADAADGRAASDQTQHPSPARLAEGSLAPNAGRPHRRNQAHASPQSEPTALV
jgi:hypothetical protein